MPLSKKSLPMLIGTREFRKELDYLYARRSAVDSLIRSLEEYDRFQGKPIEQRKRKSA